MYLDSSTVNKLLQYLKKVNKYNLYKACSKVQTKTEVDYMVDHLQHIINSLCTREDRDELDLYTTKLEQIKSEQDLIMFCHKDLLSKVNKHFTSKR